MSKELEIISNLMEACKTRMDEVSQVRATDWGIVNDALIEGQRYIVAHKEG